MVVDQQNDVNVPPKPGPVDVRQENIPVELKQLNQWVGWRWFWNGTRWTKRPVTVEGTPASSTDPGTWNSFHDVYSHYKLANVEDLDGLGFVFTADDPFCGIDLDNCYDDTGQFTEWPEPHPKRWQPGVPQPEQIISRLSSYHEVSPSGHGVKIILQAKLPHCGKAGPFEMYDGNRFFTVTGQVLQDDLQPEQLQKNAERLCELFLSRPDPEPAQPANEPNSAALPSVEHILRVARRGDNGELIDRLHTGDWGNDYDSQSEAELAYCNMLAFYTAGDMAALDLCYRRSELYRDKWDGRRGDTTYGQQTMQRAISECREFYDWTDGETAAEATAEPAEPETWQFDDAWMRLSDVTEQSINWVWPGYLPAGMVSWFVGDSTRGKSWCVLDLIARLTTGRPMPDGTECTPSQVFFSTKEDSISRTIKQRSRWLGIAEDRVILPRKSIYLDKDRRELERLLRHEAVTVLAFDTFTAHISGKVDMASNNESREKVLSPLYELAEEHDVAILMIDHPPKASYKHGPHNVLGSVAFGGAARGVWEARSGPEDTTLLTPSKMSVGPAMPELCYRLRPGDGDSCTVEWVDAAETKAAVAEQAILDTLQDKDEVPWSAIESAGEAQELSRRTLFRARKNLLLGKRIRRVKRGVYTSNELVPNGDSQAG